MAYSFYSKQKTIVLFVIVLTFVLVSSSIILANSKDSIDHWIESSSIKDQSGTNIIKVDTIPLHRAFLVSKTNDDFDNLILIHYLYGIYHNLNDNPLKALDHFQRANIIEDNETKKSYQIDILLGIANSFQGIGRIKDAINKYEKVLAALELNENTSISINKKLGILTNLAIAYTKNGQLQKSLESYEEVYEISLQLESDNPTFATRLNMARSNMGFIHLELNQPKQALAYLSECHDFILSTSNDDKNLAISFGNLAYCEYLLGNYNKAYEFYNNSLDISEEKGFLSITYVTYKDLSDTYLSDGKMKEAITYLNKHYHLKDSLQGSKIQSEFNDLEIKYQTNIKEQKILQLSQKNRIQRQQLFITYGGLAILSILCFFIYAYFKQLNKRKKESSLFKLSQAKQREELQTLKLNQLNQELLYKKQDITKLAIQINQKQEFSNEILSQLDQLKRYVKSEASKDWHKLGNTIKDRLQTNDEQLLFLNNIEEINQAFYDKLKGHYPDLSKNEKELCSFIRLGLSNKEIASLRSVSPEAVRISRYRMRKKLTLSSGQEVEQFLQSL